MSASLDRSPSFVVAAVLVAATLAACGDGTPTPGASSPPAAPAVRTLVLGAYTTPREAYGKAIIPAFQRYWKDRKFDTVEAVAALAKDHGIAPATLALAWVLAHPAITAPLVGASRPEQLQASVAAVDVAYHVEVVVVHVDDFHRVFVPRGVRDRPADAGRLRVVDRAFVVAMVELHRPQQRHDARRIDVIGDLVFHDADVVPLEFMQEGKTALNRVVARFKLT